MNYATPQHLCISDVTYFADTCHHSLHYLSEHRLGCTIKYNNATHKHKNRSSRMEFQTHET